MSSKIESDEAKGFLQQLVSPEHRIVVNCGRLGDANFTGLNLEVFMSEDRKDLFVGSNAYHPGSIYPYGFIGDDWYLAFAVTASLDSPQPIPKNGVILGDEIEGKEDLNALGPNRSLSRSLLHTLDIPEIQEAFLQSIKDTYKYIDRAQTPMPIRQRRINLFNSWSGVWAVLDDFSHIEEQSGRSRLVTADKMKETLDQIRQ